MLYCYKIHLTKQEKEMKESDKYILDCILEETYLKIEKFLENQRTLNPEITKEELISMYLSKEVAKEVALQIKVVTESYQQDVLNKKLEHLLVLVASDH